MKKKITIYSIIIAGLLVLAYFLFIKDDNQAPKFTFADPAMCFSIDLEGKIQSVNRYGAFILGYQREELIGKKIYDLYEDADRGQAKQYLEDVIRLNHTMHRWKLRKVDKHGGSIMMRETAKLVRNFVNEETVKAFILNRWHA